MKKILPLAALMAVFLALPAHAQESAAGPAYVSLGLGDYDVDDDDQAADFRLEYRSGDPLFWVVKPWVGAEATSDASIWAGGGLLLDWALTPELYVTPSFGVGVYDQGDSDKDLDYWLEFRSQVELAYQFENQHRLGVAFGHISNASLGDDNPGTEILNLYWHIPTSSLMSGF